MPTLIKVQNVKNGVVSTYTREEWDKIKNNPAYKYVLKQLPDIETLPEVKALRERQKYDPTKETTPPPPDAEKTEPSKPSRRVKKVSTKNNSN